MKRRRWALLVPAALLALAGCGAGANANTAPAPHPVAHVQADPDAGFTHALTSQGILSGGSQEAVRFEIQAAHTVCDHLRAGSTQAEVQAEVANGGDTGAAIAFVTAAEQFYCPDEITAP